MRCFVLSLLLVFTAFLNLEGAHHGGHNIHHVPCNSTTPVCECSPDYDVCEFDFTVSRIETFTRYYVNPDTGIRSIHAHPWYINEDGEFRAMPDHYSSVCNDDSIPLNDPTCTEPITVDGYTFRYVIVVNDRLPGPTLIVNQNQLVKVNVFNSLFTDTISLHFHGMLQKNTNWMDGAGGITQCSILPYMSFTYIFNATEYGTHWYHSHSGTQRTEGMYGAFIVRQAPDSFKSAEEKVLEMTGLSSFQDVPSEHTLMFSDWFKTGILAEVFTKSRSGLRNYLTIDEAPTPDTDLTDSTVGQETPDGSAISYVPFWSGLVNGKGRHESVDYIRTQLSIFTVSPDNVYRFRFIGAQSFYSYRVSIDEHKLIVIATDGVWVEPVTLDYLMVFSGERYDVLVQTDQTSKDNFMIRAETLEIDKTSSERYLLKEHNAEAILHYDRSPVPTPDQYETISNDSEPVSVRCTAESPCQTLNCPFTKFPVSYNATCMNIHQLKLLFPVTDDDVLDTSEVTDSDRIFLNFNFEGSRSSSAVNGRHFIAPSKPFTLLNDSEIAEFQETAFCKNLDDPTACTSRDSGSKDCVCPHVRTIPGGRTIQMVITNVASTNMIWFESHPIHLHGHHFHVVDVQHGNYGDDGLRTSGADGIDCGDGPLSCTAPKWKESDPYAEMGKISSAPLKDTIVVPGGGYAVVYFKSDNPGWWLMACHVLDHFFEGMGVTIYETGDTVPPPSELHRCGNFDFTVSQYEKAVNPTADSSSFKLVVNMVLILALVVMVFLSI